MKQTQVHKSNKKSLIVAGMLLSLTIIGVGGCGSTTPTSSPAASTTQSSTASGASSSNQQSQGQTAQKPALNPALKATMDISRLQRDQQNALTSDQKAKIEPILQELISTTNPSQDILQQKADAINAVLTDQQKTFIATPRSANTNKQNSNSSSGTSTSGNKRQGEPGSKQTGTAPNPQTMYQQVLDSLKK